MNPNKLLTYSLVALLPVAAMGGAPEVSNIRASQRAGTKLIDVYFDVTDPENDPVSVAIQLYNGSTALPTVSITGDVGAGVQVGSNKHIVWNAGQDWNRRYTTQGKARIIVDDMVTTPPNVSMSFVPGGFGSPTSAGYEIYTSGFFMDKLEVSKQLWDDVRAWALTHGYQFDNAGTAYATNHPVNGISWYDAVKWCNARSEKDGLVPVYYTDAARTMVYRSGQVVLDNNWTAWEANGYRLPTVAEWIKAYRGGQAAGYFPWPSFFGNSSDNLNPGLANYSNSGDPFETSMSSLYATTPVGYYNGSQVPAGPNNPNGFGLYDMAGNVGEWCWDRYFTNWFPNMRKPETTIRKVPTWGKAVPATSVDSSVPLIFLYRIQFRPPAHSRLQIERVIQPWDCAASEQSDGCAEARVNAGTHDDPTAAQNMVDGERLSRRGGSGRRLLHRRSARQSGGVGHVHDRYYGPGYDHEGDLDVC